MNLTKQIDEWKKLTIDPEYGSSKGSLHLFLGEKNLNAFDEIQKCIFKIYESEGFKSLNWKDLLKEDDNGNTPPNYTEIGDNLFPRRESFLTLNLDQKIQPDDIILLPEPTEGWYEVSSKIYEWCLPGLNPLALALSKSFQVLSTTSIEEVYHEMTLYIDGKAKFMHLSGLDQKDLLPEISAKTFDWNYFQDKGSVVSSAELKSTASEDFEEMLKLAGPEAGGYRNNRIDSPVLDFGSENLFLFRPLT